MKIAAEVFNNCDMYLVIDLGERRACRFGRRGDGVIVSLFMRFNRWRERIYDQ